MISLFNFHGCLIIFSVIPPTPPTQPTQTSPTVTQPTPASRKSVTLKILLLLYHFYHINIIITLSLFLISGTVFTCDFERDDCRIVQEGNDNFDWIRFSGQTPSGNTGPQTDHSGSGNICPHHVCLRNSLKLPVINIH